MSRSAWLLGAGGVLCGGVLAASIPGGGPRAYAGGIPPEWYVPEPFERLQPDAMRADLAFLVDTMQQIGPRPFANADREAFLASAAALHDRLTEPLRAADFYLLVAPLFATLNDGHVAIRPGAVLAAKTSAGRCLPFAVTLRDGAIYVSASADPKVPFHALVRSIQGEPSASLREHLLAVTGAQAPKLREAFAGTRVWDYLYAVFGDRATYDVALELPDGRETELTLAAQTYDDAMSRMQSHAPQAATAYRFERIGGGRVGYIDYRACVDQTAFRAFLQRTFSSIKAHPIAGLVIDIRKNGGGASSLNDDLWSYAQGKPFAQGGGVVMRSNTRLKREYGFWRYNDIYPVAWFFPDQRNVSIDTTRFGLVYPKQNPLRYHGPVYLLIGTSTFSSAQLCALAAKDFHLATIVGEETGEPANGTGEVYGSYAPRTGLAYYFTTKYFTAPRPHPDGQGIVPDVTIAPTAEDLRHGRDPVLDYAVRSILEG